MNMSGGAAGGAAAAGGSASAALFSQEDLACPICVETIEDAFATPCGHTFCFKCISTHLKNKSTCPSCGAHLVQDQIHPNFLLNKLIQHAATAQAGAAFLKTALLQHVQHDLAAAGASIGLQELDAAIQMLQTKRQQVATHESSNKLQLLMLFLQHAKARQLGQLSDLEQQLDVLQQDLTKARAATAAAAAAADGDEQQQQQQQQGDGLLGQQGQQQAPHANGIASAAVAAAGSSRSATPVPPQEKQQQQPSTDGIPAAAAAAAEAGGSAAAVGAAASLLGGRGSAFKRLQPAAAAAAAAAGANTPAEQQQVQQQQLASQQEQQQVQATLQQQVQSTLQQQLQPPLQQGFRPLAATQQQPQQGFRPLPRPQPQQQQQSGGAAMPQLAQPAAEEQQQQQQGPQSGFRPLGMPQHQGSSAAATTAGQQGFKPFAALNGSQQQQQQQVGGSQGNLGQAGPSGLASQGFRPLGAAQNPASTAGAAPGRGSSPAAADAMQAPQQQQQQGFRPLSSIQQQQQHPQQQGFKPANQQQQQQGFKPLAHAQAAAQSSPAQQGFRPLPQSEGLQAQQQQQQQQQQGFRPLSAAQGLQSQQQQQQQGFRRLAPAQGAAASAGLGVAQGLAQASLNPDKKRKILEQFDELQQAYLSSRLRRSSTGGGPLPATSPTAAAAADAGAAAGALQAAAAAAAAAGADGMGQQQWRWPAGAYADQGASSKLQLTQQLPPDAGGHIPANPAAAAAGSCVADGISPAAAAAGGGGAAAALQPAGAAAVSAAGGEEVLDAFSRMLYAVTHYSKLQPLAYVPSSANRGAAAAGSGAAGPGGAQILSSVDFDCAGQLFAAAGVQQRIFVHDYQSVLTHGGPHKQQQQQRQALAAGSSGGGACSPPLLPLLELPTGSKISCVNFSPSVQQYLLSSDYAGLVQLWDLTGGRTVRQWEAHDKRIWAVDFCPLDATTFATGSDDGTVKVWGVCEPPVPRLTLPVRANVCSIKFSPAAPHMLAAGNAGHQVHLFDLRSPRAPLAVLKGHSKAVSYVRWAGPDTLVTASTDSTLRLWSASSGRGSSDTGPGGQQQQQHVAAAAAGGLGSESEEGGWHCSQVFKGHANSKHFVGLATQGPFIACGSETNEVFMYHQGLAQPSLKCLLKPWDDSSSSSGGGVEGGVVAGAAAGGVLGAPGTEGGGGVAAAPAAAASVKSPFVSALCWKKDSDVLVAANSKGGVWVLAMQ